jgi:hypothetical protein
MAAVGCCCVLLSLVLHHDVRPGSAHSEAGGGLSTKYRVTPCLEFPEGEDIWRLGRWDHFGLHEILVASMCTGGWGCCGRRTVAPSARGNGCGRWDRLVWLWKGAICIWRR